MTSRSEAPEKRRLKISRLRRNAASLCAALIITLAAFVGAKAAAEESHSGTAVFAGSNNYGQCDIS